MDGIGGLAGAVDRFLLAGGALYVKGGAFWGVPVPRRGAGVGGKNQIALPGALR